MAPTVIRRENAIHNLNTGTRVGIIIVITAVSFVIVGVMIALTLKWYRRRYYQSLSQQGSTSPKHNNGRRKRATSQTESTRFLNRRDAEMEHQVMLVKSLNNRDSSETNFHSNGYLDDWNNNFSQRGSILSDMKELEANITTGGRASLEYHPAFKQTIEPKPSLLSQQYTPSSPLEVESPQPLVTKPKVASLPRAATAPVIAASRSDLPSHNRQVHPSQRIDTLPRRHPSRSMSEDIRTPPSRRRLTESHMELLRRGTFDAVPEDYSHGPHRQSNGRLEHIWI